MYVYRITTIQWSDKLTASGFPARWNSKGRFVLYTASSRALACLENVVHRSGEGLNLLFRTMVINVPDDLSVAKITLDELPPDWSNFENYAKTQAIGDAWVEAQKTLILQIPSAVIPQEYNYLFNVAHPEYARISLVRTEPFAFDTRIKQ